jgi:hypothetical protein
MKLGIILACGAITATALVSSPANAQSVEGIEITEYGIYTADVIQAQRDANGVLQSNVTNVRHAATTTTVPAQIGVQFGFRYRISGEPAGQPITIKKVTIYPEGGLKPPNSPMPLQTDETELARKIGEPAFTAYIFDDPWELVPGTWTIQLWMGERKLAEKAFTVVAP